MDSSPDSSGREIRSRHLGDVRISEVAVPPAVRLRGHAHRKGQVVMVLEGRYRERWRDRWVSLAPGSILYRPPGEPHENLFGCDEVLALVVAYEPERLRRLCSVDAPLDLSPVLRDLRARVALEWEREDAGSRAALEGLGLLLLSRIQRAEAGRDAPEWLRAAVDHVERRYADGISLRDVANAVGLHRTTVAAGFRRHLGRSVGETIGALRLAKALDAIRTTRRPLADIAFDCGYCDQSHMGRAVREATGTSPGRLRARRGGNR